MPFWKAAPPAYLKPSVRQQITKAFLKNDVRRKDVKPSILKPSGQRGTSTKATKEKDAKQMVLMIKRLKGLETRKIVIFAKRSQWVSISVEAIGRKPAAENYVSIHLSGARTNEPGRDISS